MASGDLNAESREAPRAWILETSAARGASPQAEGVRVWGLSARERLWRGLKRAGVAHIGSLADDAPLPADVSSGSCILIRGEYFYDERLLSGLLGARDVLLVARVPGSDREVPLAASVEGAHLAEAVGLLRSGEPPSKTFSDDGLRSIAPSALAPAYNPALRKNDPPFIFRARAEDVRRTENHIFAASYKGITDLVTKWVFPRPARAVTRRLAERGVRPNTITAIGYVLTLLVAGLFYQGYFSVGLIAGWLMSFLDTVDGKLARVTLTSSKLGGALDHGLDLIHPPIWWAAWAYGLAPDLQGYELAMWIVVGGYFVGRLLEGIFLAYFGIEVFVWRPFDAFFRTVIARRNPNLLLLSAGMLCGSPGGGYIAVAVWTAVCIAVGVMRIQRAFELKRRGVIIHPWQERSPASEGAGVSAGGTPAA